MRSQSTRVLSFRIVLHVLSDSAILFIALSFEFDISEHLDQQLMSLPSFVLVSADPPRVTLTFGLGIDPSSVSEGTDVYLECAVRAYPEVYKVVWKRNVSKTRKSRVFSLSHHFFLISCPKSCCSSQT